MSEEQSARLALRYLAAGQMQSHVTINETLTRLDALVQCAVQSRSRADQPTEPADGHLYILPDDATGADWSDRTAGDMVRQEAGHWDRVAVTNGQMVFVIDEARLVVWRDDSWQPFEASLSELQNLALLGVGTTADATNPLSAKLNTVLFTARTAAEGGDGDLRFKVNKETSGDTASVLFQAGYVAHGELGLLGNDALSLRVSPDGLSYLDGLVIRNTDAAVSLPQGYLEIGTYTAPHNGRARFNSLSAYFYDIGVDGDDFVIVEAGDPTKVRMRISYPNGAMRVPMLGVGTTADATNPLSARLNTVLFTARTVAEGGDGDLRFKINKSTATDTASLLFQSGYSGRAELGLMGDDHYRLKVSADGTTWADVFTVDTATGRTTFNGGTARAVVTTFTADGTYDVPSWASWLDVVCVGGGGGGGAGHFAGGGTDRFGGGGGGAGGFVSARIEAADLPASLTVQVGAAGAAGSAAAGGTGGPSQLSSGSTIYVAGFGGAGGSLGTAAASMGGAGGIGDLPGNAGGSSLLSATAGVGQSFTRADGSGGGGAGGALDSVNTARAGGDGGYGGYVRTPANPGAGGSGAVGAAGSNAPSLALHWAGGGGGGGSAHPSAAGYSGGTGGTYGAGGGGGGAGVTAGGAGGAGAPGIVIITARG